MSWEIKDKNDIVKFTCNKVEYNGKWMEEVYVSVTIESPSPINFQIGDYLMYRGERFEINYDPGKIKSAPRFKKGDAFKYENVKFNSLDDELTRCDFLDVVLKDNQLHFTSLPKFNFYGGVKQLADRIQANLDRLYGNNVWSVVIAPEFYGTGERDVSVDNIKVSGALSILVNDFKTYYTINGRTITIGVAGVPADHLFKYGKGQGLYEIEQNAEADQQIVTRLRAYGSTRNIPHRYYNSLSGADGKKLIPDNMAVHYLMLPEFPYTTLDPHIDSKNKDALGVREDTIFFDGSGELDEIFPSIEGMTAEQLKAAGETCNSTGELDVLVSAEQMTDNGVGKITGESFEGNVQTEAEPPTFKVRIKDVGFNPWDLRIEGQAANISFKSGMLGGREFEIVGCKPISPTDKPADATGYELELNRIFDDDIKLWFPYKDYNARGVEQNPDKPDKFVLLNIKMPEVYIKAASQLLKERAQEWLDKNDYSRSVYAPKIDEIFMARQHDVAMASGGAIKSLHDTLRAGMQLLFEDEDLQIDAAIFIDQLTITEEDENIPKYEVVLKEEKTVGTLEKMQIQIDSLAAGQGQGGGGYTTSQIQSMIDAYGGTRFLSKLKDDRTTGKISSDKGFEVGNYSAGLSGGILGLDPKGDSFAEVDRLWVRVKAFFEELTVVKSNVLAGEQYVTPGGGVKITSVFAKGEGGVVLDDVNSPLAKEYVCSFLSEQEGEKSECMFKAHDQVICKSFNIDTGTTKRAASHFYWRKVNSVNNNTQTDPTTGNRYGYVILSATDCAEGSDIPQPGDEICQFGYRYNDKPERQTAMVFSTVDADAPSVKLYSGINSYSLDGKAVISFGRDALTGKVYFRLGSSDDTHYLEYTQDGGLEVAGKISTKSNFDGQSLTNYIKDTASSVATSYKLDLSREMIAVPCNSNGAVITGFTYPSVKAVLYRGVEEFEPDSFSIKSATGITASVTQNGMITLSNLTADSATVVVKAEYGDWEFTATLEVYKVKPGANGETPKIFEVRTDADIIKRSMSGALTPSKIVISTFLTVGNTAPSPTPSGTLFMTQLPNGERTQIGRGGGVGVTNPLPISSDTTSLVIEYESESGNPYDRKVIPVLTDASDIQIGTRNLLRYSKNLEVINSNNNAYGCNFLLLTQPLKAGICYTFHVGAIYLFNGSTPTEGTFAVRIYDKDVKNVLMTFRISVVDRYVTFKPANNIPNSAKIFLYSGDDSTNTIFPAKVEYSRISLVEGNIPLTDWQCAPEDTEEDIDDVKTAVRTFDYLKNALSQNTSIEGGLILSSMVSLGENNEDSPTQITWSGLNGVYNPEATGGGIALWMGGDPEDLAEYYDWNDLEGKWVAKQNIGAIPSRIAKGVDRMDGSGYRANGNLWWNAQGDTTFVGTIQARGLFAGVRRRQVIEINAQNVDKFVGAEYHLPIDHVGAVIYCKIAPMAAFVLPLPDPSYLGEQIVVIADKAMAPSFDNVETVGVTGYITKKENADHGYIASASPFIYRGEICVFTCMLVTDTQGKGHIRWVLEQREYVSIQ